MVLNDGWFSRWEFFGVSNTQTPLASFEAEAVRLRQAGDDHALKKLYLVCLNQYPDHPQVYLALAQLCMKQSLWADAEAYLEQSLALEPHQLAAIQLLGQIYVQQCHYSKAQSILTQALDSGLLEPSLWDNLGCVLVHLDQPLAAHQAFKSALSFSPLWVPALVNDARLYLQEAQPQSALALLEQALKASTPSKSLVPLSRILHDWGMALQQLGHYAQAQQRFEQALAQSALDGEDTADIEMSLAQVLLLQGHYQRGWVHYEARLRRSAHLGNRNFETLPRWHPDQNAQAGQTLLVHAEQGYGDTLQFVRALYPLVEWLSTQGASTQVVLSVPSCLAALLQTSDLPVAVLSDDEARQRKDFTAQIPLMSLPYALGLNELSQLQGKCPYLKPDEALVHQWQQRLDSVVPGDPLRVGIAWTGRATHAFNQRRSLPVPVLEALFQVQGVQWVFLQNDAAVADSLPIHLQDSLLRFETELTDFAQTAALMANLDLVISVDTSVAHLAGALGKPLWLLLDYAHDWRWGIVEGPHSEASVVWYPSIQYFRQTQLGDWSMINQSVTPALEAAIKEASLNPEASVDSGDVTFVTNRQTASATSDPALVKLNLGCGANRLPGYVNVDCFGDVDVNWNLEQFPWPWADNSVDEILMKHVLEHLGERTETFFSIVKELYRVCKPDAKINIIVPHPRHDDFLHDPTHVRVITHGTMRLFCKKANAQWEKKGFANSRLGFYLDVDFETLSMNMVPDGVWAKRLAEGTITVAELDEAARTYNNVIREIQVILAVRKPESSPPVSE